MPVDAEAGVTDITDPRPQPAGSGFHRQDTTRFPRSTSRSEGSKLPNAEQSHNSSHPHAQPTPASMA